MDDTSDILNWDVDKIDWHIDNAVVTRHLDDVTLRKLPVFTFLRNILFWAVETQSQDETNSKIEEVFIFSLWKNFQIFLAHRIFAQPTDGRMPLVIFNVRILDKVVNASMWNYCTRKCHFFVLFEMQIAAKWHEVESSTWTNVNGIHISVFYIVFHHTVPW